MVIFGYSFSSIHGFPRSNYFIFSFTNLYTTHLFIHSLFTSLFCIYSLFTHLAISSFLVYPDYSLPYSSLSFISLPIYSSSYSSLIYLSVNICAFIYLLIIYWLIPLVAHSFLIHFLSYSYIHYSLIHHPYFTRSHPLPCLIPFHSSIHYSCIIIHFHTYLIHVSFIHSLLFKPYSFIHHALTHDSSVPH